MTIDSESANPSEPDEQQMRDLYGRYVSFIKDLRADGTPGLPIHAFGEFKTWWYDLAEHVRDRCRRNFTLGYQRLLNDPPPTACATNNGEER